MILNSSKCRIRVDLRESFLFDIKNLTKFRHDRDKSESCMRFQTLFKDSTNSNKRWMDTRNGEREWSTYFRGEESGETTAGQ